MRRLFLISTASLLLFASSASAQTQSQSQQSTGADPTNSVHVTAETPAFTFWSYEADAISGGYKMSNGWRLDVSPSPDGIVATIDKKHPIKLVAVSRDKYVSADGAMSMEFNVGAQGNNISMSYIPDARTAQVIVVTATVAQR